MPRYQGVILDIDGTLIDSNDAHARAWVQALLDFSYEISFERVRRLIGMGADNLLPSAIQVEKDSAEGKQISARYLERFKAEHLPTLKALPGARTLIERLYQHDMRLVVGSSAETEMLDKLLAIADVTAFIDDTVSSKDTKNSKPEPDVVLTALDRLGLTPDRALMLGDTPYDIAAARKVGVATIALRCGGWPDAELNGALAIYDDPAHLVREYDTSPFAAE